MYYSCNALASFYNLYISVESEPRFFMTRAFVFTLRDSASDLINVICTGSEEFINQLYSVFHINDVGIISLWIISPISFIFHFL